MIKTYKAGEPSPDFCCPECEKPLVYMIQTDSWRCRECKREFGTASGGEPSEEITNER